MHCSHFIHLTVLFVCAYLAFGVMATAALDESQGDYEVSVHDVIEWLLVAQCSRFDDGKEDIAVIAQISNKDSRIQRFFIVIYCHDIA